MLLCVVSNGFSKIVCFIMTVIVSGMRIGLVGRMWCSL